MEEYDGSIKNVGDLNNLQDKTASVMKDIKNKSLKLKTTLKGGRIKDSDSNDQSSMYLSDKTPKFQSLNNLHSQDGLDK